MPQLQVLNGPLQWTTVPILGPRFVIGRRKKCHLVLDDGWVSREHTVIIEPGPGEYVVQDLDSENGSFLNGKRISESPLAPQDILRIGRTELRFIVSPAEVSPAHPPAPPLVTSSLAQGSSVAATRALETGRLSTVSSGEALGDMTVRLTPKDDDGQRRDLKERLRRFENLLLAKEEENARLAAENAVLKRGLVSVGLIDRRTGSLDMRRFRDTGGERRSQSLGSSTYRLTWNPFARVTFPAVEGGEPLKVGDGSPSPGATALNLLGLGARGSRLAESLWRLGYRRTLVLDTGEMASATRSLPIGARIALEIPEQASAMAAPAQAIHNVRGLLQGALQERFSKVRDLDLVTLAIDGSQASQALPTLLGFLEEDTRRQGEDRVAKGVFAMRCASGTGGLKSVRLLLDAGRLDLALLADEDRIPGIQGVPEPDRTLKAVASIAALLDAVNRVALLEPTTGDLRGDTVRRLLAQGKVSTFGIGATRGTDASALEAAVSHALTGGVLTGDLPPSRARSAAIVALIGERTWTENQEVAVRLAESAAVACGRCLPQAKAHIGVYEDSEEGVRIIALLGGLPFPTESVG